MKTEKTITLMIVFLFCTALTSAVTIYPGETKIYPNEMGIENLDYIITGNLTNLNELDIKINSTNITITFPQDMIPGNYELVFFEHQIETVIQTVNVGGGSSGGSRGSSIRWRDKIVEKNITTYLDNEVIKEVPGETIEVEKIVKKTSWWIWGLIIILLIGISYLIFFKEKNMEEYR